MGGCLAWTGAHVLASASLLAIARVIPFDPEELFDQFQYGGDSDLLVLVERGRHLGRGGSPQERALQALDRGEAELQRTRKLVVSTCRGGVFFSEALRNWHLAEEELPVALLFPEHEDAPDSGKFRLDLSGSNEPLAAIVDFVRRFDEGRWPAWVRSLPVPSAEEQGDVLEVVGSTFLEVVGGQSNVLLLVYKPWCGFSKQVQPVFASLARLLGPENPHVRIARFDAESNDYPPRVGIDTSEIPQIYLFLGGNTSHPEQYTDDPHRTVEALLDWLRWKLPDLRAWQDAENSRQVDHTKSEQLAEF